MGAPDPADITRVLAEQGLWVRELAAESGNLESVFLRLTDGGRGSRPEPEGER